MKFAFKFSNLLGTVYQKGNIEFMKDGNTVISPVGNRVSLFDLKKNKSETLPIATNSNIVCLAVAPDGFTAILVDESHEGFLISLVSKSILHRYQFRKPVNSIRFSNDGKKFAVNKDDATFVYHAPGKTKEINPFALHRKYRGGYGKTTCIDWSSDSKAFAVGSEDATTRVFITVKTGKLSVNSLGGHNNEIIGCFFERNSLNVYSISIDGTLNVWNCDTELKDVRTVGDKNKWTYSDSQGKNIETLGDVKPTKDMKEDDDNSISIDYSRKAKYFFSKKGERNLVTSCAYHKASSILVAGLESGSFYIHEMPDFNLIHSLSMSEYKISSVAINSTGEWLALASTGLGQLLVWDWQSESYVMKQQGHFSTMTCLDYSPDGRYLVTGGEDSKVKVWDTRNGFCFVTFSEHSAAIKGVQFATTGHVIMSASLDGTVRAYDLHRYRNFRTFTSPRPTQFACLATDTSGELVAAGSEDSFEVFLWSVRTGRLLDVLAGHEAPVVSLTFSPTSSLLASGSWDHTVTLWKIGEEKGARESIDVGHDIVAVAFRPDGNELAVSALNAEITFWTMPNFQQSQSIECRHDIGAGRNELDMVSAKTTRYGKTFDSICYTADGEAIIAAGQTKNVCVYNIEEGLLIKKFQVTKNYSFDGMQEFLDRRKMTEFGSKALFDTGRSGERGTAIKLPGVRTGDMSLRAFKPEIRVSCVRFSPTGREWAAVSTEGLLIYSLDANMTFDPFQLDIDITPANIRKEIKNKEYAKAIMTSLRLNEEHLIIEVFEQIPMEFIAPIGQNLPIVYVEKLLNFLADRLDSSCHLHFYLLWCRCLLYAHGTTLKLHSAQLMSHMTHLQKAITRKLDDIGKVCDANHYQIQYIKALSKQHQHRKVLGEDDDGSNDVRMMDSDDEMETL